MTPCVPAFPAFLHNAAFWPWSTGNGGNAGTWLWAWARFLPVPGSWWEQPGTETTARGRPSRFAEKRPCVESRRVDRGAL